MAYRPPSMRASSRMKACSDSPDAMVFENLSRRLLTLGARAFSATIWRARTYSMPSRCASRDACSKKTAVFRKLISPAVLMIASRGSCAAASTPM